jgi:tRNA nucleotidyltransferase (CCA-adding enzyme)
MKIYKVGGAVRDSLLGRKSKDLDYAVEARDYEDMRYFISTRGTIYQERPEFFTIRAKMPGLGDADFVLCRKEGYYSDGRRPDSVEIGTIYDDLARRDFTMNAIAIDTVTNKIIDPHNGIFDLEIGILRCVGQAEDRFNEDALRIMRALRFRLVYNLTFDVNIKTCLTNKSIVSKLENVSIERVMEELNKMFAYDTNKTLNLLSAYKYVKDIIFSNPKLHLEAFVR